MKLPCFSAREWDWEREKRKFAERKVIFDVWMVRRFFIVLV